MASCAWPLCGQAVSEVLGYSRSLASLAGDGELPPGLGPVSVYGGRLDADGKRRELRDLYRRAELIAVELCARSHSTL